MVLLTWNMNVKDTGLFTTFLLFCLVLPGVVCLEPKPKYHNYDEMVDLLMSVQRNYTDLAHLYSIGKSVEGRELWVLEVSANRSLTVPNVKLVGNIHGNEPVGMELILYLIRYLTEGFRQGNEDATWLLNRARIHFLPSLNPDGYAKANMGLCNQGMGRTNANLVDLNRSFKEPLNEPEALAVARWLKNTTFVLSAALHSGALVANYPYDDTTGDWITGEESRTGDNDVFRMLAQTFAESHPSLPGSHCGNAYFPDGTTNGAAWYPVKGSMQDYNYDATGCLELTLEVSCCKYPGQHELPNLIEENIKSTLLLLRESQRGVKGVVRDEAGRPVARAAVRLAGRNPLPLTTPQGEFWRILLPGRYNILVNAEGYQEQMVEIDIPRSKMFGTPEPMVLEIVLRESVAPRSPGRSSSAAPGAASAAPSPPPAPSHRLPIVHSGTPLTDALHSSSPSQFLSGSVLLLCLFLSGTFDVSQLLHFFKIKII